MRVLSFLLYATLLLNLSLTPVFADGWGLKPGKVSIQSAGPIAFGPDGILLVGDTKAAAVVAIDTEDNMPAEAPVAYRVNEISKRIADAVEADSAEIVDMAANPISKNIYASVSTGKGALIVRVQPTGEVSTVSLDRVGTASVALIDAPEDKITGQGRRRKNLRGESITDLFYSDGRVLVAGLSSGQSASGVREFDFPFAESTTASSVEIYHAAHGRYEDYSAIRAFVPFNINGKPSLLAGYTCTPLVKFPLDAIEGGKKIKGTTIAELGNRNRPLDMIVYEKDGEEFLLMANSSRGVMKISTREIH